MKIEKQVLFYITGIIFIVSMILVVYSLIIFNFKNALDLAIITAIFFWINKSLK